MLLLSGTTNFLLTPLFFVFYTDTLLQISHGNICHHLFFNFSHRLECHCWNTVIRKRRVFLIFLGGFVGFLFILWKFMLIIPLKNFIYFLFFNCYLAVPRPPLGHSWGDSLTNPMLITAFCTYLTWRSPEAMERGWVPKPSWAPSGFWTGTFWFLLQCLNPLGHSPLKNFNLVFRYFSLLFVY